MKKIACVFFSILMIFSALYTGMTVSAEETLAIEKLEISDVSVIEGTNGNFNGYFFWYNIYYAPFTVTLKDGRVFHSDGNSIVFIDGKYYSLFINTDSQYEQGWTAGNTYTATGTFCDVTDEFSVTITESPVQKLEIPDMTVTEGANGYFNGEIFYYSVNVNDFTVTLKDGTVLNANGSGGITLDNEWYWVSVDADSQYHEPWTVGNSYRVHADFMGVDTSFWVTVTESPIESFSVADCTLYQGIDSYDNGRYECYTFYQLPFEVRLKNGTVFTSTNSVQIGDDYAYLSVRTTQDETPFAVGHTYTATAYLGTLSTDFQVTVAENPIKKIAFKKYPRNEYTAGEVFDIYGSVLRIIYQDGTFEDVQINERTNMLEGNSVFIKKLNQSFPLEISVDAENQTATVSLLNRTTTMDIFTEENLMEMITLEVNAVGQPVLKVYNRDGTTYNMTVLYLVSGRGDGGKEEYEYMEGGMVYTDRGIFDYEYQEDINGNCRFRLFNPSTGIYCFSNRVPILKWMQIYKELQRDVTILSCFHGNTAQFNGTVTSENIDDLIKIAGCRANLFNGKSVYGGAAIREAFFGAFGTVPDLTLSARYNGLTDEYTAPNTDGGGGPIGEISVQNVDGRWNCTVNYLGETVYLHYNDDLRIQAFLVSTERLKGDVNGDFAVNVLDLIRLKKAFSDASVLAVDTDVNQDGETTAQDLTELRKILVA